MTRLESRAGRVHIKLKYYNETLCGSDRCRLTKTNKGVTCKHCLKILKKYNPNMLEKVLKQVKKPIKVKVLFGSKANTIETCFETEAEKAAYILGVKNACNWHRIEIDGELI